MRFMRHPNQPLYPDACRLFITGSGRARTVSSRESFTVQLRALQHRNPGKGVRDFTQEDLVDHCVANSPSPNTQLTRRGLLMSFYGWATFAGLVDKDPSSNLKFLVHPAKRAVRRNTWLSPDEFRQLLNGLPSTTLVERRDRILVYTGALIGLRSSNLSNLTWNMFVDNLTAVEVLVKGQKLATYGVPAVLSTELGKWQAELSPFQGKDGPVFPSFHPEITAAGDYHMACQYDKSLERGGVLIAVHKAGKRVLDVDTLRPHDLRRSYAAFLESEGYSLEDICRALGHENMATTSQYMDRNPNRAVAVGRGLNVRL